jgi:hypothetical protein
MSRTCGLVLQAKTASNAVRQQHGLYPNELWWRIRPSRRARGCATIMALVILFRRFSGPGRMPDSVEPAGR